MSATSGPITTVRVAVHSTGCGHSAQTWYAITGFYADGAKVTVARRASARQVRTALTGFGATPRMINGVLNLSGTLHRDPATKTVTVDDTTAANWLKHRDYVA